VQALLTSIQRSPALMRAVPFGLFVLPLFLQGSLGTFAPYWLYAGRTLIGTALILWMRSHVSEMRWAFSWTAVGVGIGVFVVWVGLDPYYPGLGELLSRIGLGFLAPGAEARSPWNPHLVFGTHSPAAWTFVLIRLAGSSAVVPPLEEVFYRSFVYRYVIRPNFLTVALHDFRWGALFVTAVVFGLAHHEWLAGIICGLAYQGLTLHKRRLGDAITAHAITNALLGIWVIARGQWHFW
jgi:uncharacterized protein